jgi:hypothetical protein
MTIRWVAVCLLMIQSMSSFSSDLYHKHEDLDLSYEGPLLVHNSQFIYPASEKLTFQLTEYVEHHHPQLKPLIPALNTWSALHSVHPRLLTELVAGHFENMEIRGDIEDRQTVFKLSSGLNQTFDVNDPMSASKAIQAVAKKYNLNISLPVEFKSEKVYEANNRGSSGPPLFGYLQPPWPRGEFWSGGGVHANSGGGNSPRNSLDFFSFFVNWGGDTSTYWVSASQAGTARVWSSCSVSVIHPNGWETFYYHLDNVQVSDFQNVTDNQQIANYADNEAQALCQGGSSTGPHVHFAVFYNGTAIEIDEPNIDFTSWEHKAGIGHYDSNCDNSYYTLFPNNSIICPFFRQLPNNTSNNFIFANGFD